MEGLKGSSKDVNARCVLICHGRCVTMDPDDDKIHSASQLRKLLDEVGLLHVPVFEVPHMSEAELCQALFPDGYYYCRIRDDRGELDDWVERKDGKWELEEGESIMTVIRWGGEECK